ncbi:acyltransferase family protein [Butyrivibrio fibrisolvens]|uniref:acyltransferase family protein n=1 Tax=Butyrivibrio fibrisolvens TaxID=831 RepID=UPI0004028FF9|nr:acyltransferase family protein [Butyrivibrio fibrisolvens]
MSEGTKRVEWLDFAKGIGVILVIMGHMPSIVPNNVRIWIYSFHMPLFFLVAGYFAVVPNGTQDLMRTIKNKTLKLLVRGYLAFALCFMVLDIVFLRIDKETILKNVYGIFIGTIDRIYWFFLSLYVVSILFLFVTRVVRNYKTLLLVAVTFAVMAIVLKRYGINYYRVGSSLYSFGFYCLGYIANEKKILGYLYNIKYSFLISVIVSVLGSVLTLKMSPYILDISNNLSIDIVWNYILAICGIWVVIFLSRIVCEKAGNLSIIKILVFVGMNSFFFFPITNYMPELFRAVLNSDSNIVKILAYVFAFAIASCVVFIERKLQIVKASN